MSSSVFVLGASRELQNINVSTNQDRMFIINIFKENTGFSGDLVILDKSFGISTYYIISKLQPNASDIFSLGIDAVLTYLAQYNDVISDIHNSCNTPFINSQDQNTIIQNKGLNLTVRVN